MVLYTFLTLIQLFLYILAARLIVGIVPHLWFDRVAAAAAAAAGDAERVGGRHHQ